MGKVIRRLAAGTVPEQTIFDKRFVAECCETFHLHWRNLRLELTPTNWRDMLAAFNEADRKWREHGSPPEHSHLELARFLREDDAINGTSVGAELCENLYKTAPPEFSRDAEFSEEDEFVHFHYRDLRAEMSVEDFLAFSGVMAEARERLLERPEPLSRLFARLDAKGVIYVVARSWAGLPDALPGTDLDLIVHPAHVGLLDELWHAKPLNSVQRRIPVVGTDGAETSLLVDVVTPGDGYFPETLAHRALASRVRHPRGFWVPAPLEHVLTLAYHALRHKGFLREDYRETLVSVAPGAGIDLPGDGTEVARLVRVLAEHGFASEPAPGTWSGPPLPYVRPIETVISSRRLLEHEGTPVLSRVYRLEESGLPVVLKQGTWGLASREAALLGLLDSPRFPRVLGAEKLDHESTVLLEAIDGEPLARTRPADPVRFAEGCVEILAELRRAGIAHRDIGPHNLLVRDGLPVLIDFGWAVGPGLELPPALERDLIAAGLGQGGRPPEGGSCDVFAMGVALAALAGSDDRVGALVAAATLPAGSRVTDPAALSAILRGEALPDAPSALPAGPVLLAFADELLDSPGLIVPETFGGAGVARLVIYAPDTDPQTVAAGLAPLFEQPALAGVEGVLMAVPGTAATEAELARQVDAVLSLRPLSGPFGRLPRLTPAEPATAPVQVAAPQSAPPADAASRRVLVAGIYLADKPNTAREVVASLASDTHEVVQRWFALGSAASDDETVRSVTVDVIHERTPKYVLLNRLLENEDLDSYDYVLLVDDDITLPESFLDRFLPVQERFAFALAQPARTPNSFIDHDITKQMPWLLARRTRFVEIGPVVCVARRAFEHIFPFDEANGMGWGFENVWTHRLECFGLRLGIVDALPVDHSLRPPVENYSWDAADEGRTAFLAANRHVPIDECMKVLEVFGLDDERLAA